ncbi:putative ATPase [Sphingobium sp. OAS761]|uniref:AAA family ATPase n=1 Tax=Sphingobium sp. OAS761 TaxID=2817901 RepID=UPI00209F59FD|nr:AAA family ATPase [Sphingobium sp. OAS761]MCP1470815.1 putative ATPase [Sphingobium sp. OAS761]
MPVINFHVISRSSSPPSSAQNAVFLRVDHWNDYSFVTMFEVFAFDEQGVRHDLTNVKIGFKGQEESVSTYTTISEPFGKLPEGYFSAGVDADYYVKVRDEFTEDYRQAFLIGLRDVVFDDAALQLAADERVFKTSHLRSLSINSLEGQFRRILAGHAPVTDYDFRFTLDPRSNRAGYQLPFKVSAHSRPSTNIHALIGRNGVGKTTLLNEMIRSVATGATDGARFEAEDHWGIEFQPIGPSYFSSVVSISFSAFDPFNPPDEQPDPTVGTCYFYIGLKDYADQDGALLKSLNDLYGEFVESLDICLSEVGKRRRWLSAIQTLESDDNFADMNLARLSDLDGDARKQTALSLQKRMSSGHAIVLLTITKLVARLEEKTLVLFDEPESHLHPPLLSALVRSLSELLYDRNAVAIIATHSPVVLQEIPKSCVWKINRVGLASSSSRPESETFGENVGLLTRDVFGLEVAKSGFNALLAKEAEQAPTYEQALDAFKQQVGFEGRAILKALMHGRGKQ